LSTIQFRLIFKGHKSLEYCCLVIHLFIRRYNFLLYICTEIYSLKWHCVIIVRNFATANQRRERWNFTSETTSFAPSDCTNDIFSPVKNDRTGKYVRFTQQTFWRKTYFNLKIKMAAWFTDTISIDNFISEQENKASTSQKTERDVKLLLQYYTCFWKPRMRKEKYSNSRTERVRVWVYQFGQNQRRGRIYEPSTQWCLLWICTRVKVEVINNKTTWVRVKSTGSKMYLSKKYKVSINNTWRARVRIPAGYLHPGKRKH
jgi:hypothetical protein